MIFGFQRFLLDVPLLHGNLHRDVAQVPIPLRFSVEGCGYNPDELPHKSGNSTGNRSNFYSVYLCEITWHDVWLAVWYGCIAGLVASVLSLVFLFFWELLLAMLKQDQRRQQPFAASPFLGESSESPQTGAERNASAASEHPPERSEGAVNQEGRRVIND